MILRTGNNCVMCRWSWVRFKKVKTQDARRRTQDALTFIELMITVTILSIGLVFILHAFSVSVKASGLTQDITEACFLAESKISELELKQTKGFEIPFQDQAELGRFAWSYEIAPLEDSGLLILNFKVSGKKAKREEILEIVTYFKKSAE